MLPHFRPSTLCLTACWLATWSVWPADLTAARTEDPLIPFLKKNCVKCHGGQGRAKGDINLKAINREQDLLRTRSSRSLQDHCRQR